MDLGYTTIESHIRHAKQLRSEALGKLVVAGWKNIMGFAVRWAHRHAAKSRRTADSSDLIGLQPQTSLGELL